MHPRSQLFAEMCRNKFRGSAYAIWIICPPPSLRNMTLTHIPRARPTTSRVSHNSITICTCLGLSDVHFPGSMKRGPNVHIIQYFPTTLEVYLDNIAHLRASTNHRSQSASDQRLRLSQRPLKSCALYRIQPHPHSWTEGQRRSRSGMAKPCADSQSGRHLRRARIDLTRRNC